MANKSTTKKAAPARKTATTKKNVRTTKKAPRVAPKPLHEEITEKAPIREEKRASAVRFKKSYAIIALALLFLIALLYAARGLFVAATVNGQPISRLSLVQELERQSGKQALDSMVTKTLILQEAKNKNVNVTEKQIDDEIKKISDNLKTQGQDLDQVLSLQGLTRESLRDQVRIQKTVEVLLGNDIKVSDQEVADYIASNSASLPTDTDPNQLKSSISQQLRQQKLSEKFQTWLQELRQKARINYIVNY